MQLGGNPHEWWMNSGATRHVCANKELFLSFAPAQVEELIYMANSSTAKVEGTGKVDLKMTSEKVLTLNNVLYILELRRNLISVSLLDKNGFKCVTVFEKIMIRKREVYVVKGYLTEGLYKMNVVNVEINKSSNSSYLIESYNLWHERLGHAGEEAEWLRNFLKDISYWPKPVAPVCIHCDSQAVIGRAGSMMYNGKSRHIRRRNNTIRELLSSAIITVDYVKSKNNVSDSLTKGLTREGVERTSKEMGLRSRTSQHNGNST
ncbi:hypothetical protein BC332_32565 [Capsicum chinense]|nr:hypothetical protein BC332_32565 [Capsicum chinense]